MFAASALVLAMDQETKVGGVRKHPTDLRPHHRTYNRKIKKSLLLDKDAKAFTVSASHPRQGAITLATYHVLQSVAKKLGQQKQQLFLSADSVNPRKNHFFITLSDTAKEKFLDYAQRTKLCEPLMPQDFFTSPETSVG